MNRKKKKVIIITSIVIVILGIIYYATIPFFIKPISDSFSIKYIHKEIGGFTGAYKDIEIHLSKKGEFIYRIQGEEFVNTVLSKEDLEEIKKYAIGGDNFKPRRLSLSDLSPKYLFSILLSLLSKKVVEDDYFHYEYVFEIRWGIYKGTSKESEKILELLKSYAAQYRIREGIY